MYQNIISIMYCCDGEINVIIIYDITFKANLCKRMYVDIVNLKTFFHIPHISKIVIPTDRHQLRVIYYKGNISPFMAWFWHSPGHPSYYDRYYNES